jgi:hypothetical protein
VVTQRDIIDVRAPRSAFIDMIVLPYGPVACPASVSAAARRHLSPKDFDRSPEFQTYLERQCERQRAFFLATSGDIDALDDFRAEEWA